MGCCESAPVGPTAVIPDPEATEGCTMAIKSAGMFSNDKIAFQGESTEDKEKMWFFLNKQGSGGQTKVDVENFVRENPDKPKQGQVLWSASFDSKPRFEIVDKARGNAFTSFLPSFGCGFNQHQEPEDRVYFEKAGREFRDGGHWAVKKFSLQTSATLTPGARGAHFGQFQLQVFARGTAICDWDRETDDEGRVRWEKRTAEFVEALCFQVVQTQTQQVVAAWWVPGDMDAASADQQQNPLFLLDMQGGWLSTKRILKTAQGWDPVFALLVAYLCAFEYSPAEIKRDLNPGFPTHP